MLSIDIKNTRNSKAFTLIELLVVISIIALLLAMLMPALSKVKQQVKQMVCATNLKSLNMALNLYLFNNNDVFPRTPYAILTLGMESQEVSEGKTIWSCPSAISLRNTKINPYYPILFPGSDGMLLRYEQIFRLHKDEIDKLGIRDDLRETVSAAYCHYGMNATTDPASTPAGPKKASKVRNAAGVIYAMDANSYQLWSDKNSDRSSYRSENRHGNQDKLNIAFIDGHCEAYKFPEYNFGDPGGIRTRIRLFDTGMGHNK